ncbi:hypothetical protein CFP65_0053 [Kitasatospora sp. MMS16-BH015]|uniref:DUF7683 domain-containing protein n=1 Tax=Kitasatospora sp. MMS16-BH015 TaxID=2018025 RepID=UPI000CA1363C|nr:hypothetical protein [Kitasatospora sp. MMS16-BH015]AUG75039.1 hypothetical protein CFP65_0053 [Kitasatospora sp. MMS16-BH015]
MPISRFLQQSEKADRSRSTLIALPDIPEEEIAALLGIDADEADDVHDLRPEHAEFFRSRTAAELDFADYEYLLITHLAEPVGPVEAVVRGVIHDGQFDWVMADSLLWYAGQQSRISGTPAHELAMAATEALLADGLAELGEVGFEPWPGSREELLARAAREYEELWKDRQGPGFWIANTPAGNEAAKSLGR